MSVRSRLEDGRSDSSGLPSWADRYLDVLGLVSLHCIAVLTALLADVEAFWADERITAGLVRENTAWDFLVQQPQWPPHLPTWFLVPELAGFEVTIWVSILAFAATVYPTYRLGNHYAGEATGFYAANLVAVSPYLAAQGSWMRMYAPVTALLTWGLWLAVDERPRPAAACMVTAALVHPFAVFGPLWLLIRRVRDQGWPAGPRLSTLGLLPTAIVVTAVLVRGPAFNPQSTGIHHGIAPEFTHVFLTPTASLLGAPHMLLQAGLMAILVGLVAAELDTDNDLLLWIVLPVVGIAAASYLLTPVFRLKYFGFIAPAVAVLVAMTGRNHHWSVGWTRTTVVLLLLALSWAQRLILPAIVSRRFMLWFT